MHKKVIYQEDKYYLKLVKRISKAIIIILMIIRWIWRREDIDKINKTNKVNIFIKLNIMIWMHRWNKWNKNTQSSYVTYNKRYLYVNRNS